MCAKYKIIVLILISVSFSTKIGILPFINKSSYNGHWELSKDISKYISNKLSKTYNVTDFDSINTFVKETKLFPFNISTKAAKRRIAKKMDADFLVFGRIDKFVIRKMIIGEGQYGGMKNYLGEIKCLVKVFSLSSNENVIEDNIEVVKKDNLTAINIGRLSKDEELFDKLRTELFGSKEFEKSIAGKMMNEFLNKLNMLILKLPEQVDKKNQTKKLIKNAKIVHIQNDEVYVNAGLDDKVEIGDTYPVYTAGDSIIDPDTKEFLGISEKFCGKIKIEEVKASHFSRAKILQKEKDFKLKDVVKIYKYE